MKINRISLLAERFRLFRKSLPGKLFIQMPDATRSPHTQTEVYAGDALVRYAAECHTLLRDYLAVTNDF